MNPFNDSLEDTFRTRKVRVIAQDGAAYTGYVERINWNDRHFILYDVVTGDGDHIGAVLVSHATRVELLDNDIQIERLPLSELTSSPYAVKEFDRADNLEYVESVRDWGVCRQFPVVRPIGEPGVSAGTGVDTSAGTGAGAGEGGGNIDGDDEASFEIVDGHKGIWACRQAGLDTQPCELVNLSDWAAAKRFVVDHIPTARHVAENGSTAEGWYDASECEAAIRRLYADWGDRIHSLHEVSSTIERLDLTLPREPAEP